MREIKFRAWDKKQKAFINGFNMVGYSAGQGAPKRKLQRFFDYWDEDSVALMQYTDLKDKNGVKIYEGDKLRVVSSSIDGECQTWETVIEDILDFDIIKHLCYSEQLQIIGNIYDSPDLVEVGD